MAQSPTSSPPMRPVGSPPTRVSPGFCLFVECCERRFRDDQEEARKEIREEEDPTQGWRGKARREDEGPLTASSYLDSDLSPDEYYGTRSDKYENPHAEGVSEVLRRVSPLLRGPLVLDLGCGDGIATKVLRKERDDLSFIGADRHPAMVERYRKETGFPAREASFWDFLPPADSVVASYSMHLCTESRLHEAWHRVFEAGARIVVVVSPFSDRPSGPPASLYGRLISCSVAFGEKLKSVHYRVWTRKVWSRTASGY